ncbi:MAG: replicative DNA helicase [Janthinobacterium lividum]
MHAPAPTHPTVGYLPPQAIELEAAVLGAALLEAPAQRTLLSLLPEQAFYAPAHQLVYRALATLVEAGQPADLLTIVQQLRAHGTLARAGGVGFVAGLTNKINSAAHLEGHCRILLQHYARRVTIATTTQLQAKAYDESRDPLDLVTEAQTQLIALHNTLDTKPAQSVADTFDAVFTDLADAVDQRGLTGVPTGLLKLNDATGGWQPGDLIVLAARPAMGKTAVMLHAARAAGLDHQQRVAIFSLEMPRKQLVQRLVASEVEGYHNSDLRRANLPGGQAQVAQLRQQASRLKTEGHRVLIDDTPGLSIQQLRAKCTRLHAEQPLGLVAVDYIQLMRGDTKGNREQEVGSITRGLKELAKELHVPVIALAQLSRAVETRGGEKRPQLSDLRESGSIEQDADLIVFLWRGEYYKISEYADGTPTADTLLFDIAKHRNGNVGELIVGCQIARGVLFDLADVEAAPAGFASLPASQFEKQDSPF